MGLLCPRKGALPKTFLPCELFRKFSSFPQTFLAAEKLISSQRGLEVGWGIDRGTSQGVRSQIDSTEALESGARRVPEDGFTGCSDRSRYFGRRSASVHKEQ